MQHMIVSVHLFANDDLRALHNYIYNIYIYIYIYEKRELTSLSPFWLIS